jgi:rod shape-determining protein MreC
MQNLIIFITRNRVIIVFLLLEIICLHLIVRFNKNQRDIFINSSNLFTGWVYEKGNNVREFIHLKDLVDSLATENARLRTQLDKYTFDNYQPSDTIKDNIYLQEYRYLPAKVINNSITYWDNKITLNKGSVDGIKPGMGIISNKGIVGIVQRTSKHFSQGMSLLNSNLRISATHKNSGQFGTLYWDGRDSKSLSLKDVPKYAKVVVGDSILSNRYSAIFPEGLPIGIIDTFWVESGTNFYHIELELLIDFSVLDRVYVVDYLFKQEQESLEIGKEQ